MIRYKILDPDEYRLLEDFCAAERVPRPDPNFSRIAAAFEDPDVGPSKLIGFVVIQLMPHVEPIWIDPNHRDRGLWRVLAAMVDASLQGSGIAGCYTQPTSEQTRHMCEEVGWVEMTHPLYVRIYDQTFKTLVALRRD